MILWDLLLLHWLPSESWETLSLPCIIQHQEVHTLYFCSTEKSVWVVIWQTVQSWWLVLGLVDLSLAVDDDKLTIPVRQQQCLRVLCQRAYIPVLCFFLWAQNKWLPPRSICIHQIDIVCGDANPPGIHGIIHWSHLSSKKATIVLMNVLLLSTFQDFSTVCLILQNAKGVVISATHSNVYSLAFLEWSLRVEMYFDWLVFLFGIRNQECSCHQLCRCLIVVALGGNFCNSWWFE